MTRQRRLRVVSSGAGAAERQRPVFRKRKPKRRSRLILEAVLMMAGGVGLLVLLLQLPQLIDLDSLLLVSTALAHLIGGLSQLLMGVLQLLGVLLLGGLALLALLCLLGGLVRFVRAVVAPAPKTAQAKRRR
ncbi:hypothetical protein MY494_02845 [Synechococcus sp. A10-1-5-1]|uniref:hypothetical protein n=1 Tax=Synechococcus sp. A10-1-5-1 TaxID=2936507 RepID=UPI002000D102|nr:hypothetical protein [Synechococcus sp. A10-1-5-1]UPM50743.1 hypothetical protein MY494_02845 [Synechococcus sp. A10-1-5-1]